MSATLALAGAIFVAALPLALIAFGLLHLVNAKVQTMSLSNPVLIEIVDAVKADAAAFMEAEKANTAAAVDRAEKAEAALADALGVNASLEAEIPELKAELAAVFSPPAPGAEPAADAPAA